MVLDLSLTLISHVTSFKITYPLEFQFSHVQMNFKFSNPQIPQFVVALCLHLLHLPFFAIPQIKKLRKQNYLIGSEILFLRCIAKKTSECWCKKASHLISSHLISDCIAKSSRVCASEATMGGSVGKRGVDYPLWFTEQLP